GALMNDNGTMTVSRSQFQENRAVGGFGGGFPGGFGAGGAIANVSLLGNSVLSVSQSTLTYNQAIGGDAGTGATPQNGRGGGIANFISGAATPGVSATASVDHSTLLGNQARGGAGSTGGIGRGGGITNESGGVLTVSDSFIALNRAVGGAGDGGDGGSGLGSGIFNGAPNPS